MSTKSFRALEPKQAILVRIFALVVGAAAATALVAIAYATGHDSLAKGAIQGAAITLIVIAILWFAGKRFGLASRMANGEVDERERLNSTKAAADACFAMVIACIGGVIAGMYGMPAPLVAGAILWVGLIVGVISIATRTLRD